MFRRMDAKHQHQILIAERAQFVPRHIDAATALSKKLSTSNPIE